MAETWRFIGVFSPFFYCKIKMKKEVIFLENIEKSVIVDRLRAVGNGDDSEKIYDLYEKNGDLLTLYEYLRIAEYEKNGRFAANV